MADWSFDTRDATDWVRSSDHRGCGTLRFGVPSADATKRKGVPLLTLRTRRLYQDDPYLLEFDAAVVERLDVQGKASVVLDETAFYAESGGQPFDTGTLDGIPVVAVLEMAGDIVHHRGGPLTGERVHGRVDGERRRDHRQQHHGQHLLSRAFVELHEARTTSFHLGSEVSTIDLDRLVGEERIAAAERRTNEIVWEARPVRVRTVTRAEADRLGVIAPDDAGDAVRLVEAEGFDLQPCGGTHPRSTAEVGCVAVVGHERYKGGSRVRFVCGHRALAAFSATQRTLDEAAAHLSVPPASVPEAIRRLSDQVAAARRLTAGVQEQAARHEAKQLYKDAHATSKGSPPIIVARFDGRTPEDLQVLARALVLEGPCVALVGSGGEKAHLVFAQSPGLGRDIPGLLKASVAILGGRGGGRGDLAQGGGDQVDRLDEALALARSAAGKAP